MKHQVQQEEAIANCVACTLSTAMKDGCNKCSFAIGRAVREVHLQTLALAGDLPAQERLWETLPNKLWLIYWDYAFSRFYKHGGGYYPNHMVPVEAYTGVSL